MTAAADLATAINGFTSTVLEAGPFLLVGVVLLFGVLFAYGLGRR